MMAEPKLWQHIHVEEELQKVLVRVDTEHHREDERP